MRFESRRTLWLTLFCCASLHAGEPVSTQGTEGNLPFSDDAKLTLVLDQKEYFLGENILLHYCLENAGNKPFHIEVGGDYRGASRSLRFKVTAVNAKGEKVADPDISGWNEGGMSIQPEIKPGEKYIESLPLARYCRFDAPGVYTVRVTHDLGWRKTEGKTIPAAEIKITLLEPTPKQAQQVVDAMNRLPDVPNGTWGQKNEPFADFSVLRLPVYLPALTGLADSGSERTVTGIGSIARPEATQALLKLLAHPKAEVALAAAETLNARLPDPEADGALKARSPFADPWLAQRRELAKAAWKPEFSANVRECALKLLAGDDRRQVDGAFMLQCVGSKEDLPAVVRALDEALTKLKPDVKSSVEAAAAVRSLIGELLRAGEILLLRGAPVPAEPKSPGEIALFLNELKARKDFRPAGWEERCALWLGHDIPYLREQTLNALPALPASCAAKLGDLLNDVDLNVRIAACQVAGANKRTELSEKILKTVSTAKDSSLINAANNASYQLGLLSECVDIWVNRLDEPGMEMTALTTLVRLIGIQSGFSAGGEFNNQTAKELKKAWQDFVKTFRKEILSENVRIEVGGKELKAEMFPPNFKLYKRDNQPWP